MNNSSEVLLAFKNIAELDMPSYLFHTVDKQVKVYGVACCTVLLDFSGQELPGTLSHENKSGFLIESDSNHGNLVACANCCIVS